MRNILINLLFILIIAFLYTQVVFGFTSVHLESTALNNIEIIMHKIMSRALFEEMPEQIYSSIGGYFDRMEFRLRCVDGIVSNYFTKGRGAVLSDFVIDPAESLYICVPRDGIIFKNNTAFNSGGVAYLGGNSTLEFMNASFFDNKALNEKGGVVHLDVGSTVIFNVNASSETVFKGNTALGVSNSIHMLDLTNVIFSIEEGSKVQMYDALSDEISNSDTTAATLEVKGLGEFNLRKTSIIKGTNLKLDGLFKLKEGANLEGKSIDNKRLFSTVDGELNTVEVESFKNDGKIEMEVWREGGNDIIKTKDIEIEAARAKARQALIEQKNKEREERLKLKEADHKLALEKRKQEELARAALEGERVKVQAEAERVALEKRKQEEIARIEIGAAKLKVQQAADKLALKKRKQEELTKAALEVERTRLRAEENRVALERKKQEEMSRMEIEAARAKAKKEAEAQKARAEAEQAKIEIEKTKKEIEDAKKKQREEEERARREAERLKAEAEKSRKLREEVERAKKEAEQLKKEAEKLKAEAEKAEEEGQVLYLGVEVK